MRWLTIIFLLVLGIAGLFTFLGFLGQYAYFFELVSHFRPQYALAAGLCFVVFVWLKRRWAIAVSAGVLLINALFIIPYYIQANVPTYPPEETVGILLMNILSSNDHFDLVRKQIDRFQPDIVVLEEVNQKWFEALRPLKESYPYEVYALQEDNFGIWALSKVPISEHQIVYWGEAGKPTVSLRFPLDTTTVQLIATHPLPPTSPTYTYLRNNQLMTIAQQVREEENLIVVGDFNTSSFSPVFQAFAESLDLQDSRLGRGLQPTWPALSISPLMTTLDHCLVSRDLWVVRRETGGYTGSDHLPVYTEVALRKQVAQ